MPDARQQFGDSADAARTALHDWDHVVRPQLRRDVKTYDEYLIRSTVGLYHAKQYLRNETAVIPQLSALKAAHTLAFGSALKNAGSLRAPADLRVIDGTMAPETTRIGIECDRLAAEMSHLVGTAKSKLDLAAAIAYYHARIIGIRPFRDGNKRLALNVAQNQMEKLLGGPSLPFLESLQGRQQDYRAAVNAALLENNLLPLTRLIGEAYAIEIPSHVQRIEAPARVAPRMADSLADIRPLREELQLASKNPRWAQDVLHTLKDPRTADPLARGETGAPLASINENRVMLQLRELRAARANPEMNFSAEDAQHAAETIVRKQTGPDLTDAGIPLVKVAQGYVMGEVEETPLRLTLRQHVDGIRRAQLLESDPSTKAYAISLPANYAVDRFTPVRTPDRYTPLAREVVREMRLLRLATLGADGSRREEAMRRGKDLVDVLGGSGLTGVPLRTAVADYLQGAISETDVAPRLSQHISRTSPLANMNLARLRDRVHKSSRTLTH